MEAPIARVNASFAERSATTLERVQYICASTPEEKRLVFKTRLATIKQEDLVPSVNEQRGHDDVYDASSNHWNIILLLDGVLMSTARVHVGESERAVLPSMCTFANVLGPLLRGGRRIIDLTRVAANPEIARRLPELPFLTLRTAWLAAEHFHGNIITTACIPEHQAFYRRVFGFESLCLPRFCPQIGRVVVCMTVNFRDQKARVESHYPVFRSTYRERQQIFGEHNHLHSRATTLCVT
jgi:hypothetical protein